MQYVRNALAQALRHEKCRGAHVGGAVRKRMTSGAKPGTATAASMRYAGYATRIGTPIRAYAWLATRDGRSRSAANSLGARYGYQGDQDSAGPGPDAERKASWNAFGTHPISARCESSSYGMTVAARYVAARSHLCVDWMQGGGSISSTWLTKRPSVRSIARHCWIDFMPAKTASCCRAPLPSLQCGARFPCFGRSVSSPDRGRCLPSSNAHI